jgi:spore germination protein YaaH
MTYDYHLPGGLKAGPNSPLRGAGELFQHDILTNLAEITSLVPSHQILLGIPFYGYEWSTDSSEKYSPTQSRGSVASLERIESLIKENTLELLWDRNSLTPYAIRREEDKIVSQIYYESVDSIKLKLELVRSAGLGGIAIWALGYEGHNPALWQTISTLLEP